MGYFQEGVLNLNPVINTMEILGKKRLGFWSGFF